MLRPHPRSPLFPYTTLFRSDPQPTPLPVARRARSLFREERVLGKLTPQALLSEEGSDRKSTRLNSSHVKISYAVFRLKKKKSKDLGAWIRLSCTLQPLPRTN